LLLLLMTLVSACALVEDTSKQASDATKVPADVAGVKVLAVGFSDQFDNQGRPTNLRTVLPAGVRNISAYVLLQGVKPGMEVEGRWFELGPQDAGPEGSQVTKSTVELKADTIDAETSRASAFFSLATDNPALPEDSWLLRIYVNGVLVRTAAMIITSAVGNAAPPPRPTVAPAPQATPSPPIGAPTPTQ
jgi:hypothetical protein